MQEGHVRWLLEQLGDVALDAIGARQLDELVARAVDAGLHPRSVQKRFSTLRRAMLLAVRRRELEQLPEFPCWEFHPGDAPKHRWFESWEEFERVHRELPQHRADWLAVAMYTGQRASDVERMTWVDDVRLERGEIRVRSTKTKRTPLWVVCPAPLLELLRARHAAGPRADGKLVQPWPTRYFQLGRLCVRLGIAPITATGIRHSSITFAVAKVGISVAAQRWYGWSSTRLMETTYAHALRGQLGDVAAALSGPRRPPQRKRRRGT
ncbi:MAG TPA: hypothetical protein VN646_16820 [Candidatus Acidoferrum sp.]|nr:hypothetical protein [Candidatus Acidoferrum sp.]